MSDKKWRIITARAHVGYIGYVVQRKTWMKWEDRPNHVWPTLEEAKACLTNAKIEVGEVVHEE